MGCGTSAQPLALGPEVSEPQSVLATEQDEEGVPPEDGDSQMQPEPEPSSELDEPEYAQYVRHGISVSGLRHVATEFGIGDSVTTNEVCQRCIKPSTVPSGWVDEPRVTDAERGYYAHTYVCERTGERRDGTAPPGTRAMSEIFLDNAQTARFVGRPTHFLSHAWLYLFLNLVVALEAYVASLPPGEPEPFFWFDCLVLDQHANNDQGSDWWRDTFLLAIGAIGQTVMMLSPWDSPIPLRRAWCLWELYSTHKAGVPFSVCLGPDERRAFEAAILEDPDAVLNAFSQISVEKAEAGDPRDEAMIKRLVAEEVGFAALDAVAFERMREWIFDIARGIADQASAEGVGELKKQGQVGTLFWRFGWVEEAEKQYRLVLAGNTAHYGESHVKTLTTKQNLANLLQEKQTSESLEQAEALYREVVEGFTAQYGENSMQTLKTKQNLAIMLQGKQTPESLGQAEELYRQAIAGFMTQCGDVNVETLTTKQNLANLLKGKQTPGSLEQAEALYREVLAGFTTQYGESNIATLGTKENLAVLLKGKQTPEALEQAEALYREVLMGKTAQYGESNIATLGSKQNLANLLKGKKTPESLEQAEALYREVLDGYTAHYGGSNVKTLMTKNNLANLLQGKKTPESFAQAVALYREVLAVFTAQYGESNAATLRTKENLALVLHGQQTLESLEQAEALFREVLAGKVAQYGESNVATLRTKECLALLLQDQQTPESLVQAETLFREVLAGKVAQYGETNLATLMTKNNIALLFKDKQTSDFLEQAEALLIEVLDGYTTHYGESNVQTINVHYGLALVLERTGRIVDAQEKLRQVVAGFEQQLDPHHAWLAEAKSDLERVQEKAATGSV